MPDYICSSCHSTFPDTEYRYLCDCGAVLDLDFHPAFSPADINGAPENMWRYGRMLPVSGRVSFQEGFTPLLDLDYAGRNVHFKLEFMFPTGSYKDRGAATMISRARELGVTRVVEDSSGNAGCSVAAYCALCGIDCEIFVPQSTSPGKLAQIELYGARLRKIPGDRQATADAVLEAARDTFYASHTYNPYFLHGTKTFAYETAEQLGWTAPDSVVIPVGNGTLLLGAWLGFRELLAVGAISSMPRIIGVQALECSPLSEAFKRGLKDIPGDTRTSPTLAEGIAIPKPPRAAQILGAIYETGGEILCADEAGIIRGLKKMAGKGLFIEPTSAAAIAGLDSYLKGLDKDETIVVPLTGNGLKAARKAAGFIAE